MIEAALQFAVDISSVLTATGVAYIAREAHEARKTIDDNERRSRINRKVLKREGILQPLHLGNLKEEDA